VSKEEAMLLKEIFTGIWDLENNEDIIEKAIKDPKLYVVKPQREGGGNLIHGEKMKVFLENITKEQRKEYILMQRISPIGYDGLLLREGKILSGKCVSELGIFGSFLGDGKNIISNRYDGYLLRTKLEKDEDGGVAVGISYLDSLALF
jgi:glutathione synthase